MLIHLREAEVGDGFFAEGSKSLRLADFAGAELFKQLDSFGGGHAGKYAGLPNFLQQKRQ